jgi:hypothetical protein
MPSISSREAFDAVISRAAFQRLLVLLVRHGLPQTDAAQLCTEMADLSRAIKLSPELRAYGDLAAVQYEDMASMMMGGQLLPRDPTP